MSVIGNSYRNNTTNEVIKVTSINGNIAILENNERISVERLLDGNFYTQIQQTQTSGKALIQENNSSVTQVQNVYTEDNTNDVESLLNTNNLHNNLFSQLENIDPNTINETPSGGVNTRIIDPVENHSSAQRELNTGISNTTTSESDEMIERAKQNQLKLDAKIKKQTNKIAKIVDGVEDDMITPQVNRNLEGATIDGDEIRDTSVNVIEDVGSSSSANSNSTPLNNQGHHPRDEVNPMFTKMKRTKKVSLKIDIDEMMPGKDLLKMLEEGFEDSVLDYLTDEIASKVLSDATIKSQIHTKLYEYVYGKPRTPRKKSVVSKSRKTTSVKNKTK